MQMILEDVRRRMAELGDVELRRIITVEADQYQPEAIEVAPELELAVPAASAEAEAEIALDPAFEIIEEAAASVPAAEPETAPANNVEFELELTPEPASAAGKNGAATTEDFLSELAAEIDDMETPVALAPKAAAPVHAPPPPVREAPVAAAQPVAHGQGTIPAMAAIPHLSLPP